MCKNLVTTAEDPIFQIGRLAVRAEGDYIENPSPWDTIDCSDPHYRGLFIMVQAGFHFQFNSKKTYSIAFEPILDHPKYQKCVEMNKVVLVWVEMTA